MIIEEYSNYDGLGLADLIRRKDVTPEELLDEAISRTEKIDPEINAVVIKHYDFAKRQISEGLPEGPFTGVPFLLKDIATLTGTRTTYGSSAYREYVADHNSTIVERVLKTGVTIFGKTAVPEFGALGTTESRLHGPTRNPWNLAYSAGGSSGGAAAAVAARIVPVAHASDSGGSTRIPASVCGLFGLKPTRARTPIGPNKGLGWTSLVDCPHVISVSVRDSAAMLDALSGPELTSPYYAPPAEGAFLNEVGRNPGRLRIAFSSKSPYGDDLDPEITNAVREIASLLERLGHDVEERAPTLPFDPIEVGEVINGANLVASAVRAAERRLGRPMTESDLEVLTLLRAHNAQTGTAIDYVTAEQSVFEICRCLVEFFTTCEVFLCPTLCGSPIRIGELDSMSADLSHIQAARRRVWPMPLVFNMSGQPSMSMPLAWHKSGLPMGMMFSGRFGDEATLLRLAGQLEQARPWKSKMPPHHA
ncbi:amidase [Bradyrhizobium manausense]|uniref:6-aminohexanoate hydrolase n=1 Tax=Bradyrhizobium manausense TaxID=989370 RepID=A0A0R3DJI8_9BRAD|nr:amidase [Bradyrhizobium manausense]KRQ10007.1 6-aminohexanoate hydrolase [Bradyrhizobium manausense]